ncbi:MAG: DNA-binding MarR family transcriptional regulator [Dinoroseobacter sp.]|jgi:DNA-binding MarR family transcriptional regulator/N-acetylglutamate synthase-like GNAT family acetyltransferase
MDRIDNFRALTREMTRALGVLGGDMMGTGLSLSELRVLYEVGLVPWTSRALAEDLGLDESYVSRIVTRLQRGGLCSRAIDAQDRRRRVLTLTPKGSALVAQMVVAMRAQAAEYVGTVPAMNEAVTDEALGRLRHHLAPKTIAHIPVTYRDLGSGDAGWIAMRFGELYRHEFGVDHTFEAIVLDAMSEYLHSHDPVRDRVWIAERAGLRLGSIILMHTEDPSTAKLRLFFLDPLARGQGIGSALMDHCLGFARMAGYAHVTLWTQGQLSAAIRHYQKAGFRQVASDRAPAFGKSYDNQTWELTL